VSRAPLHRALVGLYLVLFFLWLFGPLAVMAVTAFNLSAYPQIHPFEGFTLEWFQRLLSDRDVVYGVRQSLWIGLWVVLVSVPTGLAGALVMLQIDRRARGLYYLVVVSPVLTPGVIIGISTVIFWREWTFALDQRWLYQGTVLTVLAQSSFISAYTMLIFLSRLQRFDRTLEEAALDLGASRTRIFFDILLPYLRPAIFTAAVLAFLSSFENYNTTTFAILADKTLTTVLAGRVRQGTTPAISALAVLIILVTVAGAMAFELVKRREERARLRRAAAARRAEAAEELAGEPAAEPLRSPA
jgi:spermidine/putrescine transport system permease protein